jgi:hypothetical protein
VVRFDIVSNDEHNLLADDSIDCVGSEKQRTCPAIMGYKTAVPIDPTVRSFRDEI